MMVESRCVVLPCWFFFGEITDLSIDPPFIIKQFPDSVDLQEKRPFLEN